MATAYTIEKGTATNDMTFVGHLSEERMSFQLNPNLVNSLSFDDELNALKLLSWLGRNSKSYPKSMIYNIFEDRDTVTERCFEIATGNSGTSKTVAAKTPVTITTATDAVIHHIGRIRDGDPSLQLIPVRGTKMIAYRAVKSDGESTPARTVANNEPYHMVYITGLTLNASTPDSVIDSITFVSEDAFTIAPYEKWVFIWAGALYDEGGASGPPVRHDLESGWNSLEEGGISLGFSDEVLEVYKELKGWNSEIAREQKEKMRTAMHALQNALIFGKTGKSLYEKPTKINIANLTRKDDEARPTARTNGFFGIMDYKNGDGKHYAGTLTFASNDWSDEAGFLSNKFNQFIIEDHANFGWDPMREMQKQMAMAKSSSKLFVLCGSSVYDWFQSMSNPIYKDITYNDTPGYSKTFGFGYNNFVVPAYGMELRFSLFKTLDVFGMGNQAIVIDPKNVGLADNLPITLEPDVNKGTEDRTRLDRYRWRAGFKASLPETLKRISFPNLSPGMYGRRCSTADPTV